VRGLTYPYESFLYNTIIGKIKVDISDNAIGC
jgi:hypothetical protein